MQRLDPSSGLENWVVEMTPGLGVAETEKNNDQTHSSQAVSPSSSTQKPDFGVGVTLSPNLTSSHKLYHHEPLVPESSTSFHLDHHNDFDSNIQSSPSSSTPRDVPKKKKGPRRYSDKFLAYGFKGNHEAKVPRPQCVICWKILANESLRPNNLRRHLKTKHPELENQPIEFFQQRLEDILAGRKRPVGESGEIHIDRDESDDKKKKIMQFNRNNERAMYASYMISYNIAKSGKPHTIGDTLGLSAVKEMFGDESIGDVEKIPISNSTVTRRIDEMAQWVEKQLLDRVRASPVFALQIDDYKDTQNLKQIYVIVRYLFRNEVHEEFLFCEPFSHGSLDELFELINGYIKKKELDWLKCVGICSDGARPVCGKNSELINQLLVVAPNAMWSHCNLHREALVSFSMSESFKNVLNTAVKIVNQIKSKPSLQSPLYDKLCDEVGTSHKALLLNTEVRWLSRGKVLTRLVELREEVVMILGEKNDAAKWLRDMDFLLKLAYLADIFGKLNDLNVYLQGAASTDIFAVHDKIRGFLKKLVLWKTNIDHRKYESFETLETLIIENNLQVYDLTIYEMSEHLGALKENFFYYYVDEMVKCQHLTWVVNPFLNDLRTGISTKADEELIDLSENTTVKMSYNRSKLLQFWLSLQDAFPIISSHAVRILVPFSSSFTIDNVFTAIVAIKTHFRNKLQLSSSLRLKTTSIEMDIAAVINGTQRQAHTSHTPKKGTENKA